MGQSARTEIVNAAKNLVAIIGARELFRCFSRCCRTLLPALAIILGPCLSHAGLVPFDLRCESVRDPLGVDVAQPGLSWKLESQTRGQRQTAFQILVASSTNALNSDQGDWWDSGKVLSDESLQTYAGRPLASRAQCFWKVRVWDRDGAATPWSTPATWRMGILPPDFWQGQWICEIGRAHV